MTSPKSLLALCLAASSLLTPSLSAKEQELVVAAGCFWCVEEIYEALPGVTEAISGYSGGKEKNPTYKQVSSGRTGHTEAVLIKYDDEKTNLGKLLKYFWKSHDASDGRGVAPDFGSQYRSELFYANDEQKKVMESSRATESKRLGKKVATAIVPLKKFWPAEDYHQDYVKKNPNDPYVKSVSVPRMKKALGK
ncbi:peptide-methionine (S)-S-oxide reductase MsrA [Verrucomicrobiaceae bacterium 227]